MCKQCDLVLQSLSDWANKLAERIKKELSEAGNQSVSSNVEGTEEITRLQQANDRLKVDVAHYQEVLANTVRVLLTMKNTGDVGLILNTVILLSNRNHY